LEEREESSLRETEALSVQLFEAPSTRPLPAKRKERSKEEKGRRRRKRKKEEEGGRGRMKRKEVRKIRERTRNVGLGIKGGD
jgi:hypothetical protein